MKKQRHNVRSGYRGYRGSGAARWKLPALLALAAALLIGAFLGLAVYPPMRATGAICLALAAACAAELFLDRWGEVSRAGRICHRVFWGVLAAGLAAFISVEITLVSHGRQESSALPADAVIVLGAGVNGSQPSVVLQSRIDAAADYLEAHPGIPAVLSGGQGPGEDITEAQAMYDGLTALGIDGGRLYLEEASTSTAENFANAKAVLEELDVDLYGGYVAVITSDFHCMRAHYLAQENGLRAIDIPARLPEGWWWLGANYYAREFFALGKTLLFD